MPGLFLDRFAGGVGAIGHLDEPLTVESLAAKANMSERTFHRRLRRSVGATPMQWLLGQRLAHAQSLLE
ncbi:helix-turn-helix domain-containing protein [Nocardia sp. NPDC047038]|uniref:helix-turn-helix domain-containing protein n=1 Tax=Nocardia sp. NPDC047038 TaxID=3154338 RepID=UPI0033E0D612